MIVTLTQMFWLGVVSLISLVVLSLRQQKILKTLAANLVTIQIKHEDSTVKLTDLFFQISGFKNVICEICENNKAVYEAFAKAANRNDHELTTQIRSIEDRLQQNKIYLENYLETCILKEIGDLRAQLEARMDAQLQTPTASTNDSIFDQIQNLSVEQLLELAKKSGATLDKITPIFEMLGKFRNGSHTKA